MVIITFIAFTLIKKANFRLDPDNIGLYAGFAVIAFIADYFSKRPLHPFNKIDFSNKIQSAILFP
jgi:hypothetical protein